MLEVINGQLKGTFKIYVNCLSQDFSNPDSFYDYLQHCIDTQCSATGIKLERGGGTQITMFMILKKEFLAE